MAPPTAWSYAVPMHRDHLLWESYRDIRSDAKAEAAAKFCLFSLATLEVACSPSSTEIALVEEEYPDAWRWSVIGVDGFITDCGSEPSRALAKTAVELALRLEGAFTFGARVARS